MNITAAELFLDIARRDVGQTERTSNRAPWIEKYWPDTSYPKGHEDRQPYCAAAVCYWLAQLGRELRGEGELKNTFGMDSTAFNKWRCKSARAFGWRDWARDKGLQVLPESATAQPGDIIVFDFSHVGLVEADLGKSGFATIEANTNAAGSREGDGCWNKTRARHLAQCLIRLPLNSAH